MGQVALSDFKETVNHSNSLDAKVPSIASKGQLNLENSKDPITEFHTFLEGFELSGGKNTPTVVLPANFKNHPVNKYVNEFWTAQQRQATSIHEVSYRACFKPQLPAFFIQRLSKREDIVYDPFSGRGTTIIEALLCGRRGVANDINPLSEILAQPRLSPPTIYNIEKRLSEMNLDKGQNADIDLSMFYHPHTEGELVSLRNYLKLRRDAGQEDQMDKWIRMVATNRLTGHSSGFFSVYTLPPNQAVSPASQIKINKKRSQAPEYRDVKKIILKKSGQLMKEVTAEQRNNLREFSKDAVFLTGDARETKQIPDDSVQLTVTSPPFLDIVQYSSDNWLRCWFNALDDKQIARKITMARTVEEWTTTMAAVFRELFRITKAGGWVAFEVGEVRNGKVRLDEYVVPIGVEAGFDCFGILINSQKFTKTSNIWGVKNNTDGTNTNRIAIFFKAA